MMFSYFARTTRRFLVTLRFSILLVFVSLFLLTTLLIITLRSVTFENELSYISFKLMYYASSSVLKELNESIDPAKIGASFTANLLKENILREHTDDLAKYTFYIVNTVPLVQRAFWANESGDFIYSDKQADKTILTEILKRKGTHPLHLTLVHNPKGQVTKKIIGTNYDIDRRLEPWYQKAKKTHQFFWTDIRLFHPNPNLGITAAAPVFDQHGQFIGVFGLDITLSELREFVANQHITHHGYSFIITANENLVAYPKSGPFAELPSTNTSPSQLVNVHQIHLPLIDRALDYYKMTGISQFSLHDQGKTFLISFEPIKPLNQYGWLVGVIIPRQDFISALQNLNLATLIISFFILLLGIAIVSKIITTIVKPINILANETEKIKRFELDTPIKINSSITEVVRLADAIRSMKLGLKQFQQYVPKILVKQLIATGEIARLGGVRKKITVFVSDIQNFTSIAERTDPNLLVLQISEYFEALSHIIIEEYGTIDKYIGDSIMAFWGAPLIDERAAYRAAKAALRCKEKSDELNLQWKKQGKAHLVTRIALHTGEAIVGNLGSSERLNYTALGDTVNIAHRLEKVNKIYKTHVIVSEAVYSEIKNDFIFKSLDWVSVKGRTQQIQIYELLDMVHDDGKVNENQGNMSNDSV